MSDSTTPQDGKAMSPASVGSQPVAWAVTIGPPGDLSVYEAFADHQKDEAISLARECLFGETNQPLPLAPLYFAPTLTDEEREAIKRAIDSQQDRAAEMHSRSWTAAAIDKDCDTLRGMLGRLE